MRGLTYVGEDFLSFVKAEKGTNVEEMRRKFLEALFLLIR